jgi:hypothetical protein
MDVEFREMIRSTDLIRLELREAIIEMKRSQAASEAQFAEAITTMNRLTETVLGLTRSRE